MNPEFWIDRWQSGRIGFHQDAVHPELRDRWSELGLSPGATVLAPLCGKSLDMRWLAERGHRVVGIELSELAVRAFFEEGREAFQIEDARHHRRYRITEGSEEIQMRKVGAYLFGYAGPRRGMFDR